MTTTASTTKSPRPIRIAAVAGLALPALLLGAPLAAADTGGAGTVRPCSASDFKLVENGRGAAAGTMHVDFALVRTSDGDGPCRVPGSVDVRWVTTLGGEQVGSWATQRDEPGEPFVVDEADVAEFTLFHANTGNYDPDECEPTKVGGIEYFVGDDTEGSYAGMGPNQYVCANTDIHGTSLSAVTPSAYN